MLRICNYNKNKAQWYNAMKKKGQLLQIITNNFNTTDSREGDKINNQM